MIIFRESATSRRPAPRETASFPLERVDQDMDAALEQIEGLLERIDRYHDLTEEEQERLPQEWTNAVSAVVEAAKAPKAEEKRAEYRQRLEQVIQQVPVTLQFLIAEKSQVAQQLMKENRRCQTVTKGYKGLGSSNQRLIHQKA
jgi:hypothetical protein